MIGHESRDVRNKSVPASLRDAIGEANNHFLKGNYAIARAKCQQIITKNPYLPDPYHILALITESATSKISSQPESTTSLRELRQSQSQSEAEVQRSKISQPQPTDFSGSERPIASANKKLSPGDSANQPITDTKTSDNNDNGYDNDLSKSSKQTQPSDLFASNKVNGLVASENVGNSGNVVSLVNDVDENGKDLRAKEKGKARKEKALAWYKLAACNETVGADYPLWMHIGRLAEELGRLEEAFAAYNEASRRIFYTAKMNFGFEENEVGDEEMDDEMDKDLGQGQEQEQNENENVDMEERFDNEEEAARNRRKTLRQKKLKDRVEIKLENFDDEEDDDIGDGNAVSGKHSKRSERDYTGCDFESVEKKALIAEKLGKLGDACRAYRYMLKNMPQVNTDFLMRLFKIYSSTSLKRSSVEDQSQRAMNLSPRKLAEALLTPIALPLLYSKEIVDKPTDKDENLAIVVTDKDVEDCVLHFSLFEEFLMAHIRSDNADKALGYLARFQMFLSKVLPQNVCPRYKYLAAKPKSLPPLFVCLQLVCYILTDKIQIAKNLMNVWKQIIMNVDSTQADAGILKGRHLIGEALLLKNECKLFLSLFGSNGLAEETSEFEFNFDAMKGDQHLLLLIGKAYDGLADYVAACKYYKLYLESLNNVTSKKIADSSECDEFYDEDESKICYTPKVQFFRLNGKSVSVNRSASRLLDLLWIQERFEEVDEISMRFLINKNKKITEFKRKLNQKTREEEANKNLVSDSMQMQLPTKSPPNVSDLLPHFLLSEHSSDLRFSAKASRSQANDMNNINSDLFMSTNDLSIRKKHSRNNYRNVDPSNLRPHTLHLIETCKQLFTDNDLKNCLKIALDLLYPYFGNGSKAPLAFTHLAEEFPADELFDTILLETEVIVIAQLVFSALIKLKRAEEALRLCSLLLNSSGDAFVRLTAGGQAYLQCFGLSVYLCLLVGDFEELSNILFEELNKIHSMKGSKNRFDNMENVWNLIQYLLYNVNEPKNFIRRLKRLLYSFEETLGNEEKGDSKTIFNLLVILGQYEMQSDNHVRAIRWFSRALNMAPRNPSLSLYLAICYLRFFNNRKCKEPFTCLVKGITLMLRYRDLLDDIAVEEFAANCADSKEGTESQHEQSLEEQNLKVEVSETRMQNKRAEASMNFAVFFHQCDRITQAEKLYREVLEILADSEADLDSGVANLQQQAATALSGIYKFSNPQLAAKLMQKYFNVTSTSSSEKKISCNEIENSRSRSQTFTATMEINLRKELGFTNPIKKMKDAKKKKPARNLRKETPAVKIESHLIDVEQDAEAKVHRNRENDCINLCSSDDEVERSGDRTLKQKRKIDQVEVRTKGGIIPINKKVRASVDQRNNEEVKNRAEREEIIARLKVLHVEIRKLADELNVIVN